MAEAVITPLPDSEAKVTESNFDKERLTSAAQLRSLYVSCVTGDDTNAKKRAEVRLQIGGRAPFAPGEIGTPAEKGGLNINFGEARAQIMLQASGLVGQVWMQQYPAHFTLKPDVKGAMSQRQQWERIIDTNFAWVLKVAWEDAFQNIWALAREYVTIGLVFAVHGSGSNDWTWEPMGLDQCKFQQGTRAKIGDIQFIVFPQKWNGTQIARHLIDPEKSKAAGWNIELLQAALKALSTVDTSRQGSTWNPEEYARYILDNQLLYMGSQAPTVPVLPALVQEGDGKISVYIATENVLPDAKDASGNDVNSAFLFKDPRAYDQLSDCMTPFAWEVGMGDWQSIKGAGFLLHDTDVQTNRALCIGLTDMLRSGGLIFQVDEPDYENARIRRVGSDMIVSDSMKLIPTVMPDPSGAVQKARGMLAQVQENAARIVAQRGVDSGGQVRSAAEMSLIAQQQQNATNLNNMFWLIPMGKLFMTMMNRLVMPNPDDSRPFGKIAREFQRRLKEAGVPEKVMREGIESATSGQLGAGIDNLPMPDLMQLAGMLPPQGRAYILMAMTARMLGWRVASDIFETGPQGQAVEMKIPMLETTILCMGSELPVIPSEPHIEHATIHLAGVQNAQEQVMAELENPDGKPLPKLAALAALLTHIQAHVQFIQQLTPLPPEAKPIGEALGAALNTLKKLGALCQAHEQAAQQEAAAQVQATMDQMPPEQQLKLKEMEMELQHEARMGDLKYTLEERMGNLQIQLKQAAEQSRIDNSNLRAATKVQQDDMKAASELNNETLATLTKTAAPKPSLE